MSPDENAVKGPVCKSGAKILYAWAMDAPKLKLPEGKACLFFYFYFKIFAVISHHFVEPLLLALRLTVPMGFKARWSISACALHYRLSLLLDTASWHGTVAALPLGMWEVVISCPELTLRTITHKSENSAGMGFKTHGQNQPKSKTEGTNGPTKWWLVTAKILLKKFKYLIWLGI